MPQGYLINNCNMPFALALLKDNEITETVYIVDGKKTRIRGYRLKSKSREMLNTKIGSLDTVKIVFERDLKSEKTLTLWLSKKHYFLPVKMQERREDRITHHVRERIFNRRLVINVERLVKAKQKLKLTALIN